MTENLVFAHNDLLLKNVLLADDNTVKLIDFEYIFYNSYLCDIYNIMIESQYDYEINNSDGFQLKAFPND